MENVKIIVVGAGIAGIAAAQSLRNNGFTNVLVVEGDNRIGGRILTEEYGVGIIEIGAQWIHGEVGNPVYELACKHGLVHHIKGVEDDSFNIYDSLNFYLSDGSFISPSVIRETSMVLDNVFNEANKFPREHISPSHDEETLGQFVQNSFYKYLQTRNDTDETKRMRDGLFNWRLTMEKTKNGCASMYNVSLGAWGEYILCEGEEAVELARGYQPVLDVLLKDVPKDSILLNTHVERILWNASGESDEKGPENSGRKVTVVTSGGEEFSADHVIVTCSLGYLKSHMDGLFLPRLPEDKASAVKRLGFGTVDKIYLEFENPFWEENCGGIQLAWLPDEQFELDCCIKDENNQQQTSQWYKGIHGFDTLLQQPNLLCGWIAGLEAELMEDLSDDHVLDVCHELLQRFTGNKTIPKPTKITRTKWFNDRYSVGSYSYRHRPTGSTVGDGDELARPLPSEKEPLLQFAGEATHTTYFSTTHGALLSGRREAERLAKLYQNLTNSV